MPLLIVIPVIAFIMWLLYRQGGKQFDKQVPPLELKYSQLVNLLLDGHDPTILESWSNKLKVRGQYKNAQVEYTFAETIDGMLRVAYSIKLGPFYSGLHNGLDSGHYSNLFSQERCLYNPAVVSIFLQHDVAQKIESLNNLQAKYGRGGK